MSVCGRRPEVAALLLLLCCAVFLVSTSLDVYPWVGKDFLDRSQEILDGLRSNMGLDVIGEEILAAIQSAPNQELIAKNLEGTEFSVKIANTKELEQTKKKNELDELRYNPTLLSKRLEGLCSVMAIDYWNYEWCHR